MKTMDERSVLASVLAVPVPVLVLDEEEAIEDLAATICAFLRSRYRQPCHSPAGRICFLLPQLRISACRGDAFCPKCGTPCGVAGATPQPVAASVNAAAAQPAKAKKKKTLAIIVAVLALVAIVVGMVAVNASNAKPKAPDFQALYDEYCSEPCAKVANDGSYLAIDTNPSDREADRSIYILEADQAIKDIKRTERTNALAGMQSETGNGVRVSWDCHPDHGLEVAYSRDDE